MKTAQIVLGVLIGVLVVALVVICILARKNAQKNKAEQAPAREPKTKEIDATPTPADKEADIPLEAGDTATLKESLATIREAGRKNPFDKAFFADYIDAKYADKAETNRRANRVSSLPLPDTHYVLGDKRRCFIYVYDLDGPVLLLVKNTAEYGEELRKVHATVKKSAFPKSKDTWLSIPVDDSYTEEQLKKIVDDTYEYVSNLKDKEEFVDDGTFSLRRCLAVAKTVKPDTKLNKKAVSYYIANKYGSDVEVKERANATSTGLPLADTHYAVKGENKKCFIYVYEAGETVILLLKTSEEFGEKLAEKHENAGKSNFPKSKDAWYAMIVDETFDAAEVFGAIDEARKNCADKL